MAAGDAIEYNASRKIDPGVLPANLRSALAADGGVPGAFFAAAVQDFQASHGLAPDGKFGPFTARAAAAEVAGRKRPKASAEVAPAAPVRELEEADAPPAREFELDEPGPDDAPAQLGSVAPHKIARLSMWAGSATLANPGQSVEFAKRVGLTDVELVINDNTKRRDWHTTLPVARIVAAVEAFRRNGIEARLLSWAVGTRAHTEALVANLPGIVEATGVSGVTLDLEEPWIKIGAEHAKLGELLAEGLHDAGVTYGITGIVFTHKGRLAPVARRAAYGIPQPYVTCNTRQCTPAGLPREAFVRWSSYFPGLPLEVGLAAYDQHGAGGLRARDAVGRAFKSAEACGFLRATWWSMIAAMRSREVADAIRDLCTAAKGA